MTSESKERMTRERMSALQAKLLPFNVAFTRSQRAHGEFIFSLRRLPNCVISPVCPMIRCGMELVEQTESNPISIAEKLYSFVLDGTTSDAIAY